ncbi:unnamed protein product [Rotaria socialis]|uniref:Uncharacterized protein n=1 Tax=Rotaria socialis TaxID=392032 RepID=A0A821RQS6_9BILA|nr:unnamed protein product [Rotaria socialis]CAF4844572.1 unnamed protein product [Rotaria socialis]
MLLLTLFLAYFQPMEPSYYGQCSYTGDPHLVPFPSKYGGVQTTYWCQTTGWELLINNSFVSISVLVGPNPYLITEYVLTFYGHPSCVIKSSNKAPPVCANTTSVTSVTLSEGSSWSHFHKTESIIVHIDKMGSYHNIYIYQSFLLIDASAGLCRKWKCPTQYTSSPIAVIPVLCDLFIDAAKKRAMGAIDPNVITVARTTCVADMQSSLDATIALAGLSMVLHNSAKSQLDCDDQTALFQQVHALKQDAIVTVARRANGLMSNTTELCNEKNQCLGSVNNINF